ncbi:hypothetical protein JTF06_02980 [Desemzia sp. RIT804]|uniref:S41 family peptidase n=1 Tax=Desemzia sp. RIT 804 TaxID=2810209 RepID=UPI0019513C8F|nr:S41 family peptidase [Desemzia sp. RIT 804]MBM6613858.1 hypothetical protein [Desemzia sp. RIT 804]
MYTKEQIFMDIQSIMSEDYAGYRDNQHLNHPDNYKVSNDMSAQEFEEMIQDYLLNFNDGHLSFKAKNTDIPYLGFSVRRYEDALYVTSAPKEKNLFIGDKIILIDGVDIPETARTYKKRLEDDMLERQRWNAVLSKANTVQILRENKSFELALANYDKVPSKPEYSFKQIESNITYIKLTDFAQEAPIKKIIQKNQKALESSENFIIDVRVNNGGNDSFYFPLLNYMFDQPTNFSDLFAEDQNIFTNHTERNYQLWIPELKEYLMQDLDDFTKTMLKEEIEVFDKNRRKGLIKVSDKDDYLIEGRSTPPNVYVLSDLYCGSSGDTFVANAKKSPKVTVVGRSTMGIIDYMNVVSVDYGDYDFIYSISKMNQKYATNGKGIAPDIYIPWTPEHLEEDIDLAYVLELIKK